MSEDLVLIDREALLAELKKAFDAQTAETLLRVLDKVAAQVRQVGAGREDFNELKQIVRELAEAQRRTEERMGSLEAAMERLAEAQARSEERLTRIEFIVEENSKAVANLVTAVDQLRKQVGGLSDAFGGEIEDTAYVVLYDILKREFGWQVGALERSWEKWGDELEEVNIFGVATDPARPGKTIWIVGETKHNLTTKEVERFIRQVERAREYLAGEVFPVCFCYRARPEVQKMVKDAGIRLVFSYGKIV
jgi:predicted nuclease with TOPRIM domain